MYLIYDTETTGLNPRKDRIVQLAAILAYPDGREAMSFNLILRCDIPIPEGAARVHGITDQISADLGVDPAGALELFDAMLARAQVAVAYNDSFDVGMITENMRRLFDDPAADPFKGVQRVCAMQLAMPFFGGRKAKLIDAHEKLVGHRFDGAHNAMADVIATKDLFFAILERRRTAQGALAA